MDIHTPPKDVTLNSSLRGDALNLNMDIHTSYQTTEV